MKLKPLNIGTTPAGETFTLPPEAVTQTFAILAKRGSGKTYTAAVLVEELLKARLSICVVDPVGVWWGLRADAGGLVDLNPEAPVGQQALDRLVLY